MFIVYKQLGSGPINLDYFMIQKAN